VSKRLELALSRRGREGGKVLGKSLVVQKRVTYTCVSIGPTAPREGCVVSTLGSQGGVKRPIE